MRTPILNHEELCSQMRELGKTMKLPEIAEELGIHYNTALHLKRRFNITVRTVQDDAADIERFVRSNPQMTAHEIARALNMSYANASWHKRKIFPTGLKKIAKAVRERTELFTWDIDVITGWDLNKVA